MFGSFNETIKQQYKLNKIETGIFFTNLGNLKNKIIIFLHKFDILCILIILSNLNCFGPIGHLLFSSDNCFYSSFFSRFLVLRLFMTMHRDFDHCVQIYHFEFFWPNWHIEGYDKIVVLYSLHCWIFLRSVQIYRNYFLLNLFPISLMPQKFILILLCPAFLYGGLTYPHYWVPEKPTVPPV